MALIEWNDEFSVGINEFDNQHKTLFDIINRLYNAIEANEEAKLQNKIFDDLILYTISHFSAEEKYMAQFNYPEKDIHKAEHDSFIKAVKDFSKEYYSGNNVNYMEILRYLIKWQKHHMANTDKKYADFFVQKGLI